MSQVSRVSVNVQYATSPPASTQEKPTEVEYLWGRITAALTTLVLAVAFVIWFLMIKDSPSEPKALIEAKLQVANSLQTKAASSKATLIKATLIKAPLITEATVEAAPIEDAIAKKPITKTSAPLIEIPPNKAPTTKAPTNKVATNKVTPVTVQDITKAAPQITSKPINIATVQGVQVSTLKAQTESASKNAMTLETAQESTPKSAQKESRLTLQTKVVSTGSKSYEVKPAKVLIHSPRISSAQLTQKLVKRTPIDELPSVVFIPKDKLLKIHFVTEYRNLQNQWIYHDWYREGIRMARVKLRPHKNKMLALSSKNIDKHMLGHWQVKVVNDSNMLLAVGEFEVKDDSK